MVLFITVGAQFFCGMSSITSASRMMYAFSRDRAVPGHQLWRRLNRDRVPYMAAIAIAVLAFLCAFPAFFSKDIGVGAGYVAYAAVTSIATIGLYIAYAIPIFLRLREGDAWEPGEWTLGKHYRWIGTVACLWVGFIAILFIMPVSPAGIPWNDDFTWLSVNYAPIALLGTFALVGVWWLVSARHWFNGPIVQGTPEELAQREAQLERGATPGTSPSSA